MANGGNEEETVEEKEPATPMWFQGPDGTVKQYMSDKQPSPICMWGVD